MLKPFEMTKIIITGPNALQEKVIEELYGMKVLHVVDHSKNELADIGKPLESANAISEMLVKVRSFISTLKINNSSYSLNRGKNLLDIRTSIRKINDELNANLDELKKAENLLSKNESIRQELQLLSGIQLPLDAFTSYNSLAYYTGYAKSKESLQTLRERLSKTTKNFMLFSSDAKKPFIALFVNAKKKNNANEILQKAAFNAVNLVYAPSLSGSVSHHLKKTEDEISKLLNKKESITQRINNLAAEYADFLLAAEQILIEELEKAEAPLKFAATQSTFLIRGWIPSADLNNSIDRLNKPCSSKISVHFDAAKKHDNVPVKLKNPVYAKPFEFFIDLYSYPGYNEFDPTFLIFLTFPIFFGIMLGDVGYGLVTLLLFWALKRRMPNAGKFFNILMLSSFISIIFGFVFGEAFGYEFLHYPLVHRSAENELFMPLAIAVGIVHVNIGLVMGFLNEMRSHGFMHAVYAKLSWIVLELGVALLTLSILKIMNLSLLAGSILIALSILMLLKGEGIKGLIELPSIFTNILSYARLMAIGLSSVILATIINKSSMEMTHKGGIFVVIGIFVLVVGHVINMMLGLLSSFLHSLRLHYVEFFSKFFHGGAKKYQPFGLKE